MLYHKKCGGIITLDLSCAFKLLSRIGVSDNNLTIGAGDIVNISNSVKIKPVFYCTNCKAETPVADLTATCMECGGEFAPDKLYKPEGSGGIFCLPCKNRLGFTNTKVLEVVMASLSLKGIPQRREN